MTQRETVGERALREVSEMLHDQRKQRQMLRDAGWEHVAWPPRVNNEPLWFHEGIGFWTQTEAIKWVESERILTPSFKTDDDPDKFKKMREKYSS